MMISFRSFCTFLLVVFVFHACKSSEEFSGFSYDPQGATITTDKDITLQHKRTIGILADGLWVSNEFKGARMNDFYQVNDSLYRVIIEPENHPINNSPWYSFKMLSDSSRTIHLQLVYRHGEHRYRPNLSHDGKHWTTLPATDIRVDTTSGMATLTLALSKDQPLWVSAQELLTLKDMIQWTDSIRHALPDTKLDTVGYSHFRRPILKMTIAPAPRTRPQGVLVITSRQHPPEVTGAMASQAFINTLTADTPLARAFRKEFEIWAYPLVNPDGVQQGHWRHNGAGVDLNRDWQAFNQPETRAIRDDLLALKDQPNRTVYYGIDFHSTGQNIFYPINKGVVTFPENFTYQWIDTLRQRLPDASFEVEPFDTSSPITKNWIYQTFGADALTYEVDDRADRPHLRKVASEAARIIMQQLLEAREAANRSPGR